MHAARTATGPTCRFARLQAELPDLAYDLERQGRRDAADVVMQIYARVRELGEETGSDESAASFIP
jgi:hypothetical protein